MGNEPPGENRELEQLPNRGRSSTEADRQLSRDTVFQTLSNRRRRYALRYLSRQNGAVVRLRDLSEWIAATENGVSPAEVTYKQRKRVYTSLYQSHLPALYRDGIVEYDRSRGTVSLTPVASTFDAYLESDPDPAPDPFWRRYWLGLGGLALVGTTAAWLEVLPAVSPSGYLVAAVLSIVMFGSAIAFAFGDARDE